MFVLLTCRWTVAFKAQMSKFQCLRTLVAELNPLENLLFLAGVTRPAPSLRDFVVQFRDGQSAKAYLRHLWADLRRGGLAHWRDWHCANRRTLIAGS
jgi:hypothetical protein